MRLDRGAGGLLEPPAPVVAALPKSPPPRPAPVKPKPPAPAAAPPPPAKTMPAAPGARDPVKSAPIGQTPAPAKQTAALPRVPKGVVTQSTLRLAFSGGSSRLSSAVETDLKALAETLKANAELRLQLKAYAAGTKDTVSRARRLSLSRALSVRSYLIKQGVRSTRIDVRALGNKTGGGPADRVDIFVVNR
ncbi:MAG: OmpA family protein [Proteobacteria bacterium]|nr:OmpA family protein [Pseudomonadota bacterium]